MIQHFVTIIFVFIILATEVLAMQPETSKNSISVPNKCIMTLSTSRANCPWEGMTHNYKQEQESNLVKAVPLDSANYVPFPWLAQFDRPDILMAKDDKRKVVVNSQYFSELQRGDATTLVEGQEPLLGQFHDLGFKRLKARDLVLFLLKAQVIKTYWHIGAELCLVSEEDTAQMYQANFWGIHKYCTNECREKTLGFSFRVNKVTGVMTLFRYGPRKVDNPIDWLRRLPSDAPGALHHPDVVLP